MIATLGSTPATLALYGQIFGDSVGALVAWRLGGVALALAGLMSILIVVRHTRADEETGRAELVGAGVVGRHAPLAAALLVAAIADAALGVVVVLGVARHRPRVHRRARARARRSPWSASRSPPSPRSRRSSPSPRGRRTGSRSPCSAARSWPARSATPARTGSRWLSPLGWGQQVRAFAGDRWWVLLLLLAFGGAARRPPPCGSRRARDLGAGILPPRPGPARGSLASPLALAWRLQRGALAGWAAGFLILGAAFGSIAQDIADVIGDSPDVIDALRRLGGGQDLVDAYLASTLQILALIAAGYADPGDAAAARRGDERPRRAAARDRGVADRWALGHAFVALAGTAAILAVAGLAAGVGHALQTGDAGELPRVLGAALAQIPAAWVLAGLALALFGLAPRAAAAVAWAALAACLALAELGPVLELSQSIIDLSPFAQSPRLPGGDLNAAPLWLAALAAALAAAGLAGLRRRDLPKPGPARRVKGSDPFRSRFILQVAYLGSDPGKPCQGVSRLR